MANWEKVHEEKHGGGSRGRWTSRLKVTGGWLVLVRGVDDAVWGGLTFIPDAEHRHPPEAVDEA